MNDRRRAPGRSANRYADELAELALGILTGRERARALAHVEGCPSVPRRDGAVLARSRLPARGGARDRAAARLRGEAHGTARSRPHAHGGSSGGTGDCGRPRSCWPACCCSRPCRCRRRVARPRRPASARSSNRRSAPSRAGRCETASLLAAGRAVGEVVVYSGSTSWLSMSLDDGSWSGKADLSGAPRRRDDGPARHVLARQGLRSLGRHAPGGNRAHPARRRS